MSGEKGSDETRDSWSELSNDKRIASADYFDRYFRLGFPTGDVADVTVAEALREAADTIGN